MTKASGWLLEVGEPATAAFLLLYLLYQFLLSHVEGDQAYLLYAGQQVLHGVQLDGPRLIETNPPLIVWFSELPALLAQAFHMDLVLALRLVVVAMLAGSAAWTARILRLAGTADVLGRPAAGLAWALTCLLMIAIQPAEFGQREQLLLALFLPYLLAVGTRVSNRLGTAERVALGVCAGLAVCFKPQHLLTVVAVELFLAVYSRSLRRLRSPELLTSVATGVLYVAAVYTVTPTYLSVITPLLESTYWALGHYSLAAMIFRVGLPLTLASVAGTVLFLSRRQTLAMPQLEGTLIAAAVGATSAFMVQHTGWYHQSFPATALFQIAAVWLVLDLSRAHLPQALAAGRLRRAAWVLLPLCSVLLFSLLVRRAHRNTSKAADMTAELATLPPGTTVYAFSVGMNAFPVLIEHHLLWGSRFAHLWMLPAIRLNESPVGNVSHVLPRERVSQLAALQRSQLTEDLARTRPAVIFVERCDQSHPCDSYRGPFDAVPWFSQSAEFAALWSHYHPVKAVEGFDVYQRGNDW